MKKWLNKARLALLSSLPVVVFFTNFPLVRLGENSSMFFEISLPMLWLAAFDLVSLAELSNIIKLLKRYPKAALASCALIFWLFLSCLWSANPLRGTLTAGLVIAIAFAIMSFFANLPNKKFLVREARLFIGASFGVSVFCILQGILDVYGAQHNLLCEGCHYQTLGFPHSNGFAIEPQFMGNLLIAPCLLSLDILYKKIKMKKGKGWPFGFALVTFIQILALFICFSRGAIYSFTIAALLIAAHDIYHKKYMRTVIYITTIIISFACGLLTQGIWAEISPTSEDFFEGISRSINQLTLGKVNLSRPQSVQNFDKKMVVLEPKEESQFNGYIEESTNVRVWLNHSAIHTWKQDQKSMLFGVGLGGAGRAISQYEGGSEREIVQNEYFSLLLEIGVVGWILILIAAFQLAKLRNKQTSFVFVAIIVAYLASMAFYSGITNVWHIYLFTPVLYVLPGIRRAKAHMLK